MATEVYVVPAEKVREAIDRLLGHKVHQHFPAYLHLRRESAVQGRTEEINANQWKALSDDLRMVGGPPGKIHLRPFWSGARNSYQEWLGENLAGSYSQSSIRRALLSVVQPDASGRFALRGNHWDQALQNLLYGERISGVALAGFMLRDRGWRSSTPPTVTDLIRGFRSEFGYGSDDDEEFNTLYELEWGSDPADVWFEVLDEESDSG